MNGKLNLQMLGKAENTKPLLEKIEDDRKSQISTNSSLKSQNSMKNKEQKPKKKKQFSWFVYKQLFKYTMKRWKLSALCLVLVIITGLILSSLPYKIGVVLDKINNARNSEMQSQIKDLKYSVYELGVIIVLFGIISFCRICLNRFIQELLAIDMKTEIYSKFIHNDMHFFEQYKSGQLISRLGEDINKAKSAVSNNLTFLIRNIITIFLTLIALFAMSWKLSLMVIIVVPFYAAVTVIYNKKMHVLIRNTQTINAQMTSHVSEKFNSIELVKAYNGEEIEINKYTQINQKLFNNQKNKTYYSAMYYSTTQFLPYISTLIVLWYGGSLIIEGNSQLTPGELTSFILYCTNLAFTTSGISSSYSEIINGVYAIEKVFEMLQYKPLVNEISGQPNEITGGIIIDHLKFKYPSSTSYIFQNLSLKIKEGEYVAFVGQSGSGKSTIIKLIQNFYCHEEGQIYFNGQNSKDLSIKSIRSQIGLVNQQASLFSGTIRENITYGILDYSQKDLLEAAKKAGCMQFICNQQLFPQGFQTIIGQRGGNISGGQRQRISIARALMRKPKIIIFDEATSALDANSETLVQESIENIAREKEQMVTIIVIAHRLSTVINADRIFVMKQGQIMEQGSHKDLKNRKKYYYQLIQKQLQKHQEVILQQ